MAKPIRKTPSLTGAQAETFVKAMMKTQSRRNMTKAEELLFDLANSN